MLTVKHTWLELILSGCVLLTLSGCHSGVKNGDGLSNSDIRYLQKIGLLDKQEHIILFEHHGGKLFKPYQQSGNFFTDKRIAAYWIDKDPKRSNKDFALYEDIDSITTKDRSTALTYASYLKVYRHNGGNFKVFVDGDRQTVNSFFNAALAEWNKHKKKPASVRHDKFFSKDTMLHGDQTIYPFKDTSYKLIYHVLKDGMYNEDEKNTTLTFVHASGNKIELLFRDSLYSMHNMIEFHDMNSDGLKDIMVFYNTGARANPTYHLYLQDTVSHQLIRVKGFEELPNPDLDAKNNIISSGALYADKVWYEFYRINKQNKLQNLGHAFEYDTRNEENDKFDEAVKAILKKYGKEK